MTKLTKRAIDALAGQPADYFEWDDELPGFGVRVWPSGRKTYVAQYRASGRTRRFKIGNHGALTVEEARRLAKTVLGDVARGEDPATERATRRSSITIAELCDDYLKAADKGLISGKRGEPKKASTLYTDRGRVIRHIKPLLGKVAVKDLSRADVTKFLRDVATGKTAGVTKTDKVRGKAVVEGGLGTASRTVGLLGSILSFAVGSGIIDSNAVAGVKRPADKRRDRRLTAAEFRQLGEALQASENEGELAQAVQGAWLLALTGCRLGDVVALKHSEIDAAGGCFRLEDSKEGASVRPIGRAAFDIVAQAERREGNPYVLPAARGGEGPYGSLAAGLERITKAAGLDGVTAHTLRHSFASVAGDLGYSESTIAAMLGHAGGTVTSRYIHHLDTVLVAAADKVARTVHEQMTGKAAGKVVQMPRRGRG